jgi:prevent-host-death family protein
MTTIEIDELKDHINDALQRVEENGEIIEVTRQGQVVARLVPVQQAANNREKVRQALADIDRLAEEIGKHWPEEVSAEDAVNDVRGDSW